MTTPGLDPALVTRLFGTLDTLKDTLTKQITDLITHASAGGAVGEGALQKVLDGLNTHHATAVSAAAKATKTSPPKTSTHHT